jgi:hypothetical protein
MKVSFKNSVMLNKLTIKNDCKFFKTQYDYFKIKIE